MAGEHRVHYSIRRPMRIDKSLGDAAGLKNLGIHLMTVAPGDTRRNSYPQVRGRSDLRVVGFWDGGDGRGSNRRLAPAISSAFQPAARRMRPSTTERSRWSASSSANGLRRMSSTTRATANGFTATAASGIWWTSAGRETVVEQECRGNLQCSYLSVIPACLKRESRLIGTALH